MLAAAVIAIVGEVVAVVVVEADAVRAAAVAGTMVAAVAAEDGKASIVASCWQKQIQGPQRCGLFCLLQQRITND
jgi:hypothetical protein